MAEDAGDFQAREYFMREFYRYLDKNESARVHTVRVVQATTAIR